MFRGMRLKQKIERTVTLTPYQKQLDWIASQQAHMVFLTEKWSRINSGSYNIEGLRAMRRELADHFLWLHGDMKEIPLAPLKQINAVGEEVMLPMAEAFSIVKRPEAAIQILLMGHMDTVYGIDHPFQMPVFQPDNILNGPGVADLKGGLVVMLKALEAFEQSPWAENIGWQVLINPDEEIGSISSDALMREAVKGKRLGLVYEPALADGSLAGERKGSGNFSIVVTGKAAHAGRNPQDGRNAIVAAAELTQAIFALNGKREGVTINPARIDGGSALNVVPDNAVLRFNIRTLHAEDEKWILDEIEALLARYNPSPIRGEARRGSTDGNDSASSVPSLTLPLMGRGQEGFTAKLHGFFTRQPKPMSTENKAIFDMVKQCGAMLGLTIGIKPSGGCCDGNNLWKYGLPNVDTLGVRGANIHSAQEIVYLDSLTERAQLSALLLMRLAKEGIGG
jgi:glutamate carboxypeptidase